MKLYALGFIISTKILSGFDHELQAHKSRDNQKRWIFGPTGRPDLI